jgi:hypothetical protein
MDRDEPPLDLTGNIRRLEEHPCAGGSYGDIYKCLYDHTSGTIEVKKCYASVVESLLISFPLLQVAVKALRLSLMPNQGEQSSSERLPDVLFGLLVATIKTHALHSPSVVSLEFGGGLITQTSSLSWELRRALGLVPPWWLCGCQTEPSMPS